MSSQVYQCVFCGPRASTRSHQYFKNENLAADELGPFANSQVVVCNQCDVGTIFPICTSEALRQFYSSVYIKNNFLENSSNVREVYSRAASQYVESVAPKFEVAGRDIVEIGANATGWSLLSHKLSARSYSYFDAQRSESIDALGGVYRGFFDTDSLGLLGDQSVDLVVLSHSFEHLLITEAGSLTKGLHRVINKGGYLFIEVPIEIGGSKVEIVPPHTLFFTPSSLEKFLSDRGFHIDSVERVERGHSSWLREYRAVRAIFFIYRRVLSHVGNIGFNNLLKQLSRAYFSNTPCVRILARRL